jgi:hypothetical protein
MQNVDDSVFLSTSTCCPIVIEGNSDSLCESVCVRVKFWSKCVLAERPASNHAKC